MAVPKKLLKFLEESRACPPVGRASYDLIEHRTVYTAYDKAATLRLPLKTIGKTLLIRFGKEAGIALIPGQKDLDGIKLKQAINKERQKRGEKPVKKVEFATEQWMKRNLKDIKPGAIPPFGSLWKVPTFVDRGLLKNKKIIVNAGDYNWSIRFNPANLKGLIPDLLIGNFSKKRKAKSKRKTPPSLKLRRARKK